MKKYNARKTFCRLGIFCFFLLEFASCEIVLVDERGDDLEQYDYYIDEFGNEGIVVYSGVVMSLDEVELPWGPLDYNVLPSATPYVADKKSYGIAMLYAMRDAGLESFSAQAWCAKKNFNNEYRISSWHLPSYHDWKKYIGNYSKYDKYRVEQIDNINHYIEIYGGTQISKDECYWTCDEDFDGGFVFADTTLVYDFDPENRALPITPILTAVANKDKWVKRNVYKVRAIKFVYEKSN